MSKVWFKPKSFGYGATPASWEGWVVTLLTVPLLLADVRLVPRLFADHHLGEIARVVGVILVFAGLIWLTVVKGDGVWRLNRED